jgi:lipoprotein-releasing system permease protein
MWNRFAWSMAFRHLRHNMGQTLLTTAIVAVSVILLILLSTLTHGIQGRIFTAVTESMPHVSILPNEYEPTAAWKLPMAKKSGTLYVGSILNTDQHTRKIDDWSRWIPRLKQMDDNIIGVSPTVESQAILFRGSQPRSVSITGVFPREHDKVVAIQSKLVAGKYFGMTTGQIVIGKMMADEMGLKIGDKLRMVASQGNTASYTLVGLFRTGSRMMDQRMAFVPLRDAQSLFGMGTSINKVSLKLKRIFEANTVADLVAMRVPYDVHSWMRDNKPILTALQSQETTFNLILLLTTIAAGFAIASILIMAVVSKFKELGILKAMGATRMQIVSIFTLQGALLSFLGGLVGTGLSILFIKFLHTFESRDEAGFASKTFSIVEINVTIIFVAIGIAVLVGFLAALYPAWRAAKVNPIEVIRGA